MRDEFSEIHRELEREQRKKPKPKLKLVTRGAVDEKQVLLDKLLVGNPDTVARFGSQKAPAGFVVMKVDQVRADKYYYIKYDGAFSGLGTRKEVFSWIKANQAATLDEQ